MFFALIGNIFIINAQTNDTLWLSRIDLSRFTQDWNLKPKTTSPLDKQSPRIAGRDFSNGLASRTEGLIRFKFDGKAQKLQALFGVDDRSNKNCRVTLTAIADNKEIFRSRPIKRGSRPASLDINLQGVKELALKLARR